ncbi:hypothetical protein Tco_1498498, partial [Tanacetum coccineum]
AGNLGDNEDEPRDKSTSRRDWFKKPTPPQEPTNPDWNVGKTTKEGLTQTWLMNLAASNPTDKSLKNFDELMSTPIDFSGYILNGLKIENLTQEILLGPTFRLLKGTLSNYAELEYKFEECYKALSKKLNWENSEGGDYPFDFSKPLPLITRGKQHAKFDESDTYMLESFDTPAGNPVKKILLKLNLSDHRKHKEGGEGTCFQLSHKDP